VAALKDFILSTGKLLAEITAILAGIGDLTRRPWFRWPIRAAILVAGLPAATPGGGLISWSNLDKAIAAAALLAACLAQR
jgi:hypothetical protein